MTVCMPRPREMYVLRRAEGLEPIFNKLLGRGPLADDTETSGLLWHQDRVGAINLAANDVAIMAIEDALGPTARFVGDQIRARREFVFHNGKFDMHMQRETFGHHFPYPVHDTRLSSFLLDNRGAPLESYPFHGGHSLKPLSAAYIDPDALDNEKELLKAIAKRGGKHKGDWPILLGTEDEHIIFKYGPMDAWYTLQLHRLFMDMIHGWIQPEPLPGLPPYQPLINLYRTEQWVLLALRDMEEAGIRAKARFLERWMEEVRKERDVAYRDLWKAAGKKEINWNSPPQIVQLLYGKRAHGGLGIVPTRWTDKQQTKPSTDKIALVLLNHPIGAALLRWRKADKRYTDAASILKFRRPDTGTIHPNFNQNVDTGRMSCSEPNLQNREREGDMKRAFVPRKGLQMRSADYSQVELRLAAHAAQEPALLDAFRKGLDPHRATGQSMFGTENITDEQRVHGKTLNFAGVYGAGIPGITEQMMAKLSQKDAYKACLKLGYRPAYSESPWVALATLLVTRHRKMMPAIGKASKRSAFYAKRRGYAMNMMGRHRFFRPDEDAHIAFNTDIQGTAADLVKAAMVRVYRELQVRTGEIQLLLQVHDELVFHTDGDPRTDLRVKELMEDHDTFSVPIVVDLKDATKNWKDKVEIKL